MADDKLRWLSTSDLEALDAGDITKVSDQGLRLLEGGGKGGSFAGNLLAGGARGVRDVIDTGAQLLSSGFDKLAGTNEGARVRAINDAGERDFQADYGGSTAATVGRVGGNVAATLPVGGFLGAGIKAAAPLTGAAAPTVAALGNATASGGMRTGLPTSGALDLAVRTAGGAIGGGATAGLVNPADATTGAAIGAVLPGSVRALGRVGDATASAIRGPAVAEGVRDAAQLANQAGYVIPPTQVRPSLVNRVLEGSAGKISTAQNASARNQALTNELAAETLGLPRSTLISPVLLDDIRKDAGQAYRAVASLPVKPAERAQPLLNKAGSPEINPAAMVEDLKQARNDAQSWFRAYNRSASPDDLKKARAADALSKELESGLESYASSLGEQGLVQALRDARVQIAKTYTVERALNPVTGNVDAQTLAKLAKKGPLSGGLKSAADFATAFPKAAQPVERMGSLPQISPLDLFATGGASALSGNPAFMTGLLVRPLARATALSAPVQRGLLSQPAPTQGLLSGPAGQGLLEYAARSGPVLGTSR